MKKQKVQPVVEELEDTDEVDESTEVYSAKAVATMFGTDGRTFRKFLRSKFGKVGQGNRWEIAADKIEELRTGFAAFNKPKVAEVKVLLAPADADLDEDLEDLLDDEAEDLEEIEI